MILLGTSGQGSLKRREECSRQWGQHVGIPVARGNERKQVGLGEGGSGWTSSFLMEMLQADVVENHPRDT